MNFGHCRAPLDGAELVVARGVARLSMINTIQSFQQLSLVEIFLIPLWLVSKNIFNLEIQHNSKKMPENADWNWAGRTVNDCFVFHNAKKGNYQQFVHVSHNTSRSGTCLITTVFFCSALPHYRKRKDHVCWSNACEAAVNASPLMRNNGAAFPREASLRCSGKEKYPQSDSKTALMMFYVSDTKMQCVVIHGSFSCKIISHVWHALA